MWSGSSNGFKSKKDIYDRYGELLEIKDIKEIVNGSAIRFFVYLLKNKEILIIANES